MDLHILLHHRNLRRFAPQSISHLANLISQPMLTERQHIKDPTTQILNTLTDACREAVNTLLPATPLERAHP